MPSKSPQRPPVKVTSLCKARPGLTPNLRLVRSTVKGNSQLLVSSGPLTYGELTRHNVRVKVGGLMLWQERVAWEAPLQDP